MEKDLNLDSLRTLTIDGMKHAIRDSASPRPKMYWTRTFEGLVPSLGITSNAIVTPTSFYFYSGKREYLNKIIRFNTSVVRMKMNPCEEIRLRQMPQTFQEEMKWFAKGCHHPKRRCEISSATIDAFQAMIWDKPYDELLPTYGCYSGC